MYAVACVGLGDEIADVGLDRGHGEPEVVANFLIAEALGDEFDDLALTLGQRLHKRAVFLVFARVPWGVPVGGEEPACGARRDDRIAAVNRADRRDELVWRGVLEEESGGAMLDGGEDVLTCFSSNVAFRGFDQSTPGGSGRWLWI